jgi:acetyl-CoA C-acetyltransferase
MANRVAIVGVGQTHHTAHRPDVNQVELMNEAVRAALRDADLSIKDVDAFLMGNMELFEGSYLVDMWAVDGIGSYMKPGAKITSGGTTGASLAIAAFEYAASGLFDIVLAVGFEKQEEGNTQAGIVAGSDPLWGRWIFTSSLGIFARTALEYMRRTGAREEHAAMLRVKADRCACRNPYAHLKLNLTMEDVLNSRMLVYPLRFLDMCPVSNGACALIVASEAVARRISDKPVWVADWVTVHDLEGSLMGAMPDVRTHEIAAAELYKRNQITDVRRDIDVAEIYEPSSWGELEWYELYHFCERGEAWKLAEKGTTDMEGEFPVNPSGGVVSTNPIGATAMIRIAEAALQVRGDAGTHQVTREVRTALATGWGGSDWTTMVLLKKSL